VRQQFGEKVNVFSIDCRLRSTARSLSIKARTSFIGTIAAVIARPRYGRISVSSNVGKLYNRHRSPLMFDDESIG
jgi:hypothetical protein